MAQIRQHLVAADIDGAEHYRLVAGGIEYITVEPGLAFARRQRRRNQELELGAEQTDAISAGQTEVRHIVAQPGVDHNLDAGTVESEGFYVAHGGKGGLTLAALGEARVERGDHPRRRTNGGSALGCIEQQRVTVAQYAAQAAHPAQHRYAHSPRDNHDMRGQRALLQDHPFEPPLVIFEQFGRAEIAGYQDGVAAQPLRGGGAELTRNRSQQPVG